MSEIDLHGKKGLVYGVANNRSIAWAISQALAGAGAEVAFTYQNERLRAPVEKTVSSLGEPVLLECDATDDSNVEEVSVRAAAQLGRLDIVVHCIAFAGRDDLGGDFSATDRDGFRTALEASAYTLIPVTRYAAANMGEEGGSVVTMTFDASTRETCIVRTGRTNTPLQALNLMNDVTYIEAARRLAEKMIADGGMTPEERLSYGYRTATAHRPRPAAQAVLMAGLQSHMDHYQNNREAALELISMGESPRDETLDVAELASYTMVASLILNLDGTITKE